MPYAEFALGMYPILYHKCITVRPDLFTASPALADEIRRVRYDYNKTLAELFGENFAETVHRVVPQAGDSIPLPVQRISLEHRHVREQHGARYPRRQQLDPREPPRQRGLGSLEQDYGGVPT